MLVGPGSTANGTALLASAKVLIGLVAGLGAGGLAAVTNWSPLVGLVTLVEPLGMLFINAIRMTVIPLVVSTLIVGVVGAGNARTIRKLGVGSILLFLLTLVLAASFAILVGSVLLAPLQIEPASAAALRAQSGTLGQAAADGVRSLPTFSQWLVSLVPVNAVAAAAEGALLPLMVFTLAFAFALAYGEGERQGVVVELFRAIADAMLALVRWVLKFAPLGVFALGAPLAARLGLAVGWALVHYMVTIAVACTAFTALVIYPAGVFGGGFRIRQFAKACVPSQMIALSARASLAALPAMIQEGRDRLALSASITAFLLPFAAAVFRTGSVIGTIIGAMFVARLYDVPLQAGHLLSLVATAVLMTFSTPGVPSGSLLVIVPILLSIGVPAEGVGILFGVDTIPDIFRSTTNVTGNMAAAAVLNRMLPQTPTDSRC